MIYSYKKSAQEARVARGNSFCFLNGSKFTFHKSVARILEGLLSSINCLFKSVDYNKREISVIQRVQ